MTDSGAEPRFSDDRQWWWTGTEWVPASQAPQPAEMAPSNGDDWIATSSDGPSKAGNEACGLETAGHLDRRRIPVGESEAPQQLIQRAARPPNLPTDRFAAPPTPKTKATGAES